MNNDLNIKTKKYSRQALIFMNASFDTKYLNTFLPEDACFEQINSNAKTGYLCFGILRDFFYR